MSAFVAVTGASSGIGRALAVSMPFAPATLMTVSRRPAPAGDWLEADLSDAAMWPRVAARFADALARGPHERAVLLHFAGVGTPHAMTPAADPGEYTAAVLLNCAAGPVLGQAFLAAARRAGVPTTVVLCSSPGAATPMAGMSHYGSGKAGMEYWVRAVTAERDGDVCAFAVVPFAVDTPMVREVIRQPAEVQPVAAVLRAAAERGELASAESAAAEIWDLVAGGAEPGAIHPVGAVPAELRRGA